MGTWVFISCLLWIMLQWTSECRHLFKSLISILLARYSEVRLLGHTVVLPWIFGGNSHCFPELLQGNSHIKSPWAQKTSTNKQRDIRKFWKVFNRSTTLVVTVSWVFAYVYIIHIKYVQFFICQLYLNKAVRERKAGEENWFWCMALCVWMREEIKWISKGKSQKFEGDLAHEYCHHIPMNMEPLLRKPCQY